MTEQGKRTSGVRIGVDFGESLTLFAVCDPIGECHTIEFPGISREVPGSTGQPVVHVIPSLLQYSNGRPALVGHEVASNGVAEASTVARWMRRYLCDRSPVQLPAGDGRTVRYEDASADFLTRLFSHVMEHYPEAGFVFALPSDAPAEYADLLQRIARSSGASTCSFISEYLAAATGCGFTPVTGESFIIISFSDNEPEIAVIATDQRGTDVDTEQFRVIARTSSSAGCRSLDTWIVQDLLIKFRLFDRDPRAVRLSPFLYYQATQLREQLPVVKEIEVQITDTISGKTFVTDYTLADLDRVLMEHEVAGTLLQSINRVVSGMRMKGGDIGRITTVLLVGSGCTLPVIQDTVKSRFPEAKIYAGNPLDAVARGAATYAAAVQEEDRITCSYALRYWDSLTQEHHYRFLVHSGTRYPSAGQVARIVISAAYDGQTHLGIPLYEIGGKAGEEIPGIELVSDIKGGVYLAGPAQDADAKRQVVHANVHSPTLLTASPPARKGEPRFECTFSLDHERNLCLSARDLVTGMLVKLNAPIHRLK
jgi:molecular chaperone DnaK